MRFLYLVVLIVVFGLMSVPIFYFMDQGDKADSYHVNDFVDCDDGNLLTQSPIAIDELTGVVPLGNLNPPDHTLPTRHTYWYTGDPANPPSVLADVVSPGYIKIIEIHRASYADRDYPTDYTVRFALCDEVTGYFNHIMELDPAIEQKVGEYSDCVTRSTFTETLTECVKSVDIEVGAGDRLGTVSYYGTLDFGMDDIRVVRKAADSETLNFWTNAVCPVDYYVDDVKSDLESKMGWFDGSFTRIIDPVCGQIHYDIDGTAQGVWFKSPYDESVFSESQGIALVWHNIEADKGAISIGSVGSSMDSLVLTFDPIKSGNVNVPFDRVTADGNVYCYQDGDLDFDYMGRHSGVVLVQLIDSDNLNFEAIPDVDSCSSGVGFSSDMISFTRQAR